MSWLPISRPENGNSEVISYSLEFDAGTNGEVWVAIVGYLTDSTQL